MQQLEIVQPFKPDAQLSLLGDSATAEEDAASEETDIEQQGEPVNIIEEKVYNSVFVAFRTMHAAVQKLVAQQQELEREVFGHEVTKEVKIEDEDDVAKRALDRLFAKAQADFAPDGGSLKIDQYQFMSKHSLCKWHDQYRTRQQKIGGSEWYHTQAGVENDLDFDDLWSKLKAEYSGEAGERAGLAQSAAAIIKYFRLDRDEPVMQSGGGVALTVRVYSTKKDWGDNKGKFEVHSAQSEIGAFNQAMASFIFHSGTDALQYHDWRWSRQTAHSFAFAPREKISLYGCEISLFKDKWTYKFSKEAAKALMLFLGEYGSK